MIAFKHISLAMVGVWASWWVYFAVASSINDGVLPKEGALVSFVVFLIFFGSGAVAWYWEKPGGALLILVGVGLLAAVLGFFHKSLPTTMFLVVTLAVPPLVSGLLLLAYQKQ
jgi:hypothetical protein